jgi:hypothetical protein
VPFGRNRESRTREAAGRRNWPEAVPKKMGAEKGREPVGQRPNRITLGGVSRLYYGSRRDPETTDKRTQPRCQ